MPCPDIRLQEGLISDNNTTCIITISLCNHSPTSEHKLLSSTRMCMDYVTASQMRVGVMQMTLSCVMSAGAVCQIFHVPQRALCPALVIKTSPPSHSPYNTPTPGLAHSAASQLSLLSDPAQISRVTVCNPQITNSKLYQQISPIKFQKENEHFFESCIFF